MNAQQRAKSDAPQASQVQRIARLCEAVIFGEKNAVGSMQSQTSMGDDSIVDNFEHGIWS